MMRCRLEGAIILFLLIITSNQVFAQTDTTHQVKTPVKPYLTNNSFRTWSIGVHAGVSTTYTLSDNIKTLDFTSPDPQTSYGGYVKDQLTRSFGIQADFLIGKLQADHAQERLPNGAYIYSQFDTKLNWSAALSANFIIAHIHGKSNKSVIQPYLTLGIGEMSYTPVLHYYFNQPPTYLSASSSFFVPAGLGLKFDLTRGVNLDIGYQVNFVMADNVDGYKYGSSNDRFSYSHIGLEFALGKSSKRQLAAQTKSKVVQNKNSTPPQPLIAPVQTQQTVVDSEKIKSEQVKRDLDSTNARLARLTADSDGDGVPDVKDKCPNTPANTKVDTSGCPLPATVIEVKPPVMEVKPVVATDEDKRIIRVAARSIEFYTGTEIISGRAFPNLNSVVKLLIEKKLLLNINAYTNKTRNSNSDLALAKLRAEAVKNYLVNRGADASKINVEG
ncbi:MAG: DUF6089 family protein, partial [Mucilaginibacter sp.]